MTPEMWITLAILVVAIILFVTELLRVDLVALGVMIALTLTGVLSVNEALAGFSNTAVLTIAALFILGGAVLQTGLASMIAQRILSVAGTNETRLMIVLMIAVSLMSGFMSDTGVVAVMLPAVVALAASAKIAPSKLLIPLAYGSLLGGATTLIGTPPNIIVADLLQQEGLRTFDFFSYTPLGILLIIGGILFMLFVGRHLLPDRQVKQEIQDVETPAELFNLYRLPENLFRLRVRSKSPLVGQPLGISELRSEYNATILEILRQPQPRSVMTIGNQRLMVQPAGHQQIHATPDTILKRDDILLVQGDPARIGQAAGFWNLAIQPASPEDEASLITQEVGIAEIVLPPRSSLIGKTLTELRFGTTYRLTVLDIKRAGVDEQLDLKSTSLRLGDTLLVQGEWKDIFALKPRRRDFIVMGETETLGIMQNRKKAPVAAVILLAMTVIIVLDLIPLTLAAMIAGVAVVLSGCLTMDDAYEVIDWKSLVLIAGMLPMSTALVNVGLVDLISQVFVDTLGNLGPVAVMGGLFLLTSIFTQVLSNTATAVLIAPIALASAQGLGIQPHAYLMAVAVAASMAFASPVASPVNTLVMGAGNYRFSDYVKIGVPMILVTFVISLLALPILFPF